MGHHHAVVSQPTAAKFQSYVKAISRLVQDNGHGPTVASPWAPRKAVLTRSAGSLPEERRISLRALMGNISPRSQASQWSRRTNPGLGGSVAAQAVNASSADGYPLGLDVPHLFGRQ